MNKSAILSACGQYRYSLTRQWAAMPVLAFVMLNPSTADADQDDPTIRKCIGFAQRLGFGGIHVVNLFAHRATDPADLKRAGYPVGPENDRFIAGAVAETRAGGAVVCAWGVNARRLERPLTVLAGLRALKARPQALKLTPDGIPCHPLMLPYACTLQPLRDEIAALA